MSRPCFALSVMLCCMAGPLLIIGKAHARDTVVSPSHDPGECIVCPLAHGPLEVCGGYSDYDYNQYWHASPPPVTSEAVPESDPEVEVAQSLTDDSMDDVWEAGYEDYYADYVFGDDSTNTTDEVLTSEDTPKSVALVDVVTETASELDATRDDATSELYDEYGWYSEDSSTPDDYFDSYDRYEPIETTEAETTLVEETPLAEATVDYEAYEEEWFSYGLETTVEATQANDLEADEAYEALSESASESYSYEIRDADHSKGTWGDEEEWYREEYGYEGTFDKEIPEGLATIKSAMQLETGYDEAYDAAMITESKATEPVADAAPALDNYESFYDAYDDLYNFESAAFESSEYETTEAAAEAVSEEPSERLVASEPAWLTDLVTRMLAPVWTVTGGIASETSNLVPHLPTTIDECAQQWDCEADCWARPQAEQPSIVLGAADMLDGMASLLRGSAEGLRGLAVRSAQETARATAGNPPR